MSAATTNATQPGTSAISAADYAIAGPFSTRDECIMYLYTNWPWEATKGEYYCEGYGWGSGRNYLIYARTG